jgi:Spy/CpxP family protein refolding chaperone
MKIRSAILLSALLLLLQISDARTQQLLPKGRMRGSPPCLLPEDLDLTRQQLDQMKSIERRYLNDMAALRTEILNERYRLRKLLSDPTSRATDIRSQQKQVFALENRIQERILDYQLEVRDILTPEQFRVWVSRHGGPLGHRMHHGHGKGRIQR